MKPQLSGFSTVGKSCHLTQLYFLWSFSVFITVGQTHSTWNQKGFSVVRKREMMCFRFFNQENWICLYPRNQPTILTVLQIYSHFQIVNCSRLETNFTYHFSFILQRSHFGFGNAEAPWKSFHAHEWATFFVNSILTHSLVVQAMYSQRILEGLPKFGWMTTKSIITLLYLWRKMFHLESKSLYSIKYLLPLHYAPETFKMWS